MSTISEKKESFSAWCGNLFVRYSLLVNGTLAAVIAGLGVIASQILTGAAHFDLKEVYIMMLINFAYHTPVLMWFNTVLRRANMKILPMLVVDQVMFSPIFTAGIVALRLLLLGADPHSVPATVLEVVPKAMVTSWIFWVPAKAFIFMYVPPMYQILAGCAFSFVWTIIFAMILQAK